MAQQRTDKSATTQPRRKKSKKTIKSSNHIGSKLGVKELKFSTKDVPQLTQRLNESNPSSTHHRRACSSLEVSHTFFCY